jgi:hypothetical protein
VRAEGEFQKEERNRQDAEVAKGFNYGIEALEGILWFSVYSFGVPGVLAAGS